MYSQDTVLIRSLLRCRCVLVPAGDWFKFHLGHLTDVEHGCRQSLLAYSKVLP